MKHTSLKLLFGILALVICTQIASALTLNPFKRSGRSAASVLMVTGNYLDSRLLVELAQYRTKQPIILISPEEGGKYSLYFMPSGTKSESESAENFMELVDLVNPKRIIFVGNSKFVPSAFVDAAQKKYPAIQLVNEDWLRNAQLLGDLLEQPSLPKLYTDHKARVMQAQAVGRSLDEQDAAPAPEKE